MKKYFWVPILIVAAIAVYFSFYTDGGEAGLRKNVKFAVKNVEDIDKITIKDREGNFVILEKKGGIWYVNNDYKAFAPVVDNFLTKTLSKVRIIGPVPKPARENVIRSMVGHSKHVIIYSKGKELRNYYVGNPNPSQTGSYVHLEGSETPYIAHVIGFKGIIDPKFSSYPTDWYDRSIFDFKSDEIASISVTNHELAGESFELNRKDSTYLISPTMPNLSQSAARSYFSLFSFKNFEGFADYLTAHQKDSIAKSKPFMTISVSPIEGDIQTLRIFRKSGFSDANTLIDKSGQMLVEDTERYFATFTGFDKLVTIQDYTFGKLITKRSFFDNSNSF